MHTQPNPISKALQDTDPTFLSRKNFQFLSSRREGEGGSLLHVISSELCVINALESLNRLHQ